MPSKRVLLIEDDPDYEQLISAVLAACGDKFEVKSASALAAGLALIGAEYLPDLILVDLNLPDSSGYETFLRVRERAPEIPIIVLTGLDDDHLAIRAVEDGAQDYLVKNMIQPKLIARSVNMALSRQKRRVPPKADASLVPGAVLSFIGSKGGVGTSTTSPGVRSSSAFAMGDSAESLPAARSASVGPTIVHVCTSPVLSSITSAVAGRSTSTIAAPSRRKVSTAS